MGTDLMERPFCPSSSEHGRMSYRPPGSPEQAFCGTWYGCDRCRSSVLFHSPALEAQLAEQAARLTRREAAP